MRPVLCLATVALALLLVACSGSSITPRPTPIPECDTTNGLPPSKQLDVVEGLEYRLSVDVMCTGEAVADDAPTGPYVWVTARVGLEASAGLIGGEQLVIWIGNSGGLPTADTTYGWPAGFDVEATWERLPCEGDCHGLVATKFSPFYVITDEQG